jgi:hypothetical protein
LPATHTGGVVLLILATVAAAFAAGRLTRSTPTAAAAAPATTLAGFGEDGPITDRRTFDWQADDQQFTVRLNAVTVGVGFSRLEFGVDSFGRRLPGVTALDGLRIQDAAGNDLLPGGEIAHINTASSDHDSGGSVELDVVLDRAIDLKALARVQVRGLTIAETYNDQFKGVLVDPELQRHLTEDGRFLHQRPSCPDCRVRVDCTRCHAIRVAGAAYHRDRVLLWLEPVGPTRKSGLDALQGAVVFGGDGGGIELDSWVDSQEDQDGALVAFDANELANRTTDHGKGRMAFDVAVSIEAEQQVRGRWVLSRP